VVRLAATHPGLELAALTGDSQAGKPFSEVYPHLALSHAALPPLVKIDDVDWAGVDAAFCCLPHATTQKVIAGLPKHIKVVDLSADFRLADTALYEQWYGNPHAAPDLQKEAVYGLTEFARGDVAKARLVANPGCYPTCVQLALAPLLSAGLIATDGIIIDAKSGVSGAGRSAKLNLLYTEIAEGINAYGVGSHRHMPEIEQGLSAAANGAPVTVSFTPHLMPMARGMLATSYVVLKGGASVDGLRSELSQRYASEPFVHVLPAGGTPHTRHVRGSNHAVIGVFEDRIPGRAIVLSVIDNLVKGASGQAIQNLNVMMGWRETLGLDQAPMFP
jgi:N-acetyl-gamma-glutamyl-phosphate reductase